MGNLGLDIFRPMKGIPVSQALRQVKAMIAERTQGLFTDEAAAVAAELMDNPSLKNYYSQEGKLFVTLGDVPGLRQRRPDLDQRASNLRCGGSAVVVQTLPCQRVALEYPCKDLDNPSHWQFGERGQVTLATTKNGDVWAFTQGGRLFRSQDGGKSWAWTCGSTATDSDDLTFTVLADDSFLVVGSTTGNIWGEGEALAVHRSTDQGRTWKLIGTISPPAPYARLGDDTPGLTQLSDGTILLPTQVYGPLGDSTLRGHIMCRSTDGGSTWSTSPVTWEANQFHPDAHKFPACRPDDNLIRGEAHVLELASGRLLMTLRYQWLHGLPGGEPWAPLSKQAMFLDSDDGGLTWTNARPTFDAGGQPILVNGECHGWCAQLADGRIVLVHDHRFPHVEGQTIARVSHDEGRTWERHTYHLIFGAGYPATLALDDGTILTVSGAGLQTPPGKARTSRNLWTTVAIRWNLPPATGR